MIEVVDSELRFTSAVQIEDMYETCALDVADRGPQTLQAIGDAMGLTRERVRQIEADIMRKIKNASNGLSKAEQPTGLSDYLQHNERRQARRETS